MIKMKTTRWPGSGSEISESEITAEEACRYLHVLSRDGIADQVLICESEEDKTQLVRTYYDMYHEEFNSKHQISDEEQMHLQLAYPAETDVFYVENLFFRFEAGIRELDPRYARVNTHQTCFRFQASPICEYIINNTPNKQKKDNLHRIYQNIIYKHEELNHPSYEDAQEYLEYIWTAYQEFFQDGLKNPSLERIIEVNSNFDLPWYERVQKFFYEDNE